MQERSQADKALNPLTLGDVAQTLLKILMSTRNRVIKRVMRPGITSGGIKKLTYNIKNSFHLHLTGLYIVISHKSQEITWSIFITQETTTKSPEVQ